MFVMILLAYGLDGRELPVGCRDLEEIAADPIARTDVDQPVAVDRHGSRGHGELSRCPPQDVAIGGLNPRDAGIGKLDDLLDAADLGEDRQGVVDAIGELLAPPDQFSGLLVKCDQ